MRTSFLAAAGAAAAAAVLFHTRRQRRHTERLAAASLEALLAAIDANAADTGAHVRRVASYAILLARAAGLPEARVHAVERVALFHDIGKVHEALFDIVHDDDALSDEERERIATHPQRGAEVLAPLEPFYPELAAGVLAHHERWDGTGYPRGLRGEAIPIEARVVAVADTFDAITAGRNYRDASSLDEARAQIARARGTQFDPALVDLFLSGRIQQEVARERERMAARQRRLRRRGRRGARARAPDVTFRWRDGAAAPPPPDPGQRTGP